MKLLIRALIGRLILICLLAAPLAAAAEDAAKYSFATAQGDSNLEVIPGDKPCQGVLYIYNVDGNRITHIAMDVVDAPEGWIVEFSPAVHSVDYTMGGGIISVEENLSVEPSELSSEPIKNVPTGMFSILLPNKLGPDIPGYAVAQVIYINITVPKGVPVGESHKITVKAEASWLGQTGAGAIAQERNFDLTVNTVYKLTKEKRAGFNFDWNRWMPLIGGIAVAVVAVAGAVFIPKMMKKGKKM
ncbi:MAG: hypothetical protein NTV30_11250 [Chloroflexi bacterium]|nr:hypothetical protein [Chloroflexota bacterium]